MFYIFRSSNKIYSSASQASGTSLQKITRNKEFSFSGITFAGPLQALPPRSSNKWIYKWIPLSVNLTSTQENITIHAVLPHKKCYENAALRENQSHSHHTPSNSSMPPAQKTSQSRFPSCRRLCTILTPGAAVDAQSGRRSRARASLRKSAQRDANRRARARAALAAGGPICGCFVQLRGH